MRKNLYVGLIALFAGLGGFLFGYDTGAISGALLYVQADLSLSTVQEEFIVASLLISAAVAAPFAGILADAFGRKKMILLSAFIFFTAALVMAFAPDFATLVTGRVLVGLSIGIASLTVPMYVSEMSPPQLRGRLVSLNQLLITVGIVCSYAADYMFAHEGGWRWMLGISGVPAAVLFIAMLFLPESPRWYLSKGKHTSALKVFKKIGSSEHQVQSALGKIRATHGVSFKEFKMLLDPALRAPLLAGILLAVFQQLTGINTIIYYAPTILSMAGHESNLAAILSTFGIGLVNVASTFVALFLIDRFGRRPLLIWGTLLMAGSLAFLSAANYFGAESAWIAWLYNGSLFVYIIGFAIGLGPIAWLFISEIYPQRMRGAAMSVATFANWGTNFLVAMTYLTLFNSLGASFTFGLYACITAVAIYYFARHIPETKEKTLEEIQEYWE